MACYVIAVRRGNSDAASDLPTRRSHGAERWAVTDDLSLPLRARELTRLHDPVALLAVGCELPACIRLASIGGNVAAGPYSRVELRALRRARAQRSPRLANDGDSC
jgi:hypothetical protein